jgi:uncharacterized protein (DUF983 family)
MRGGTLPPPRRYGGGVTSSRPGGAGLWRALRARCLRCGSPDVFDRWGEVAPRCPSCDYRFEREEGYWVGAMIVNLGAAMLLFLAIFLLALGLTWPDVPWFGAFLVSAVAMLVFPIWFYPRSKTIWVWLDQTVHPYTTEERGGGGEAGR